LSEKNNPEKIEEILEALTSQIIAWEEGDVLGVSEIMSGLEELEAACAGSEKIRRICGKLLELSGAELKGSSGKYAAEMSEGIDLLKEVTGGEQAEWKAARMEGWLSGGETGGKAGGEAGAEREQKKEEAEDRPEGADSDQLELFAGDCEERLSRAQDLVLELEKGNGEGVKELFRIFHTIKGECGFLKLGKLGRLAHESESLLDGLRSGKLEVSEGVINVLLEGVDLGGKLVKALKEKACEEYRGTETERYEEALRQAASVAGEAEVRPGSVKGEAQAVSPAAAGKPEGRVKGEGPTGSGTAAEVFEEKREKKADSDDYVVKIKTGKVNYLVDMIGELMISLGQMKEETEGLPQVKKIARTLQYAGMQLRTESVKSLFGTVRRIIRDTVVQTGKKVKAEFSGEELEIDRTLIGVLEEPLMHLVRNAVDHGIESAAEREAAGKSAEGTVRVAAERRGNNIVITVADDGRGLDRKKIVEKAVAKGLIKAGDGENLSDSAVNSLIFIPGFSTNEKVTQISGRGVGMDIVKSAVEKAKGTVRMESREGAGTAFHLYFPLSTAIIDGMAVRSGQNIFIIPVGSVEESLKAGAGQILNVAEGVEVLNLRGKMIPVIRLSEVFGTGGRGETATIVENVDGEEYAVMSDEILSKKEVVIKSLGAYFRDLKGISSGTVLAGGKIGYVLDIEQVVELGRNGRGSGR